MSYTQHYVQEQISLLQAKGYTEDQLGSPDNQGTFAKRVESGIYRIVNDAFSDKDRASFDAEIVGFFDENKRCTHFDFTFSFDPNSLDLSITKLKVSSNYSEKLFSISRPEDIRSAIEFDNLLNDIKLDKKKSPAKRNLIFRGFGVNKGR